MREAFLPQWARYVLAAAVGFGAGWLLALWIGWTLADHSRTVSGTQLPPASARDQGVEVEAATGFEPDSGSPSD